MDGVARFQQIHIATTTQTLHTKKVPGKGRFMFLLFISLFMGNKLTVLCISDLQYQYADIILEPGNPTRKKINSDQVYKRPSSVT